MHSSKSVGNLAVGAAMFGVAVLLPARASGSEVFPPAIQQAAEIPCTPTCTLCHTTNPGNIMSWTGKPFGRYMGTHGTLIQQTASLQNAFATYKADPANATGVMRLKQGLDPDTGQSLCGPVYGCSLRVAEKAPRSDIASPLFVVGALAIGALLRRRKREG